MISMLLRSRQFRVVGLAVVVYGLCQGYLSLKAPGKVAPEIDRSKARVAVVVELPFVPERFHVLTFQRYGRVSGTSDHSVELRGVRPADLESIARYYWVLRVVPLPPDQ